MSRVFQSVLMACKMLIVGSSEKNLKVKKHQYISCCISRSDRKVLMLPWWHPLWSSVSVPNPAPKVEKVQRRDRRMMGERPPPLQRVWHGYFGWTEAEQILTLTKESSRGHAVGLHTGREKCSLNWSQRPHKEQGGQLVLHTCYLKSFTIQRYRKWGATSWQGWLQDGVRYLCKSAERCDMAACKSWDRALGLRRSSPVLPTSRSDPSMKASISKMHLKLRHLSPASLSPLAILHSVVLHKSVNEHGVQTS